MLLSERQLDIQRQMALDDRAWRERMESRNRLTLLVCAAIGVAGAVVAALAGTAFGFWLSSR